ncbi:MAG: TspO/MBR family protein [Phycisphaerales bacterium]
MRKSELNQIIVLCLILLAIMGFESLIVRGSMDWYKGLEKPVFNPPGWVFGPVWTILYVFMGISFFIIWRKGAASSPIVKTAVVCFIFQLVFNFLWTPIFFGLKQPLIAFGNIVILWLAVLATVLSFLRVSKIAAALLIPYFLWVSFAAVLNAAICMMNA